MLAGLLVLTAALISQEHEPDLTWLTLTTPHFSVHFPDGFEELGHKVAAICEEVYEPVSRSLNYFPHRTHLVIHTRRDDAPGFVSLLPHTIEIGVPGPQINYEGSRDEWLRMLINHEFTHTVQARKHRGFSTATYPLFGEFNAVWQGITPEWYLEGFATLNETRFTRGGRGRNPYHWMQMAAPLNAGKPWKLENTNFPSRQRMPLPIMYVSGYYFSHYMTQRYGDDVWAKILDRYSAFPLLGFGWAAKAETGKSLKQLYREMQDEFSADTLKRNSFAPAAQLWLKPGLPENQLLPRWRDDDHLVIYRWSFGELPELIELHRSGKRRQIAQRWLAFSDYNFAVGKKSLIWAEYRQHPRYSATLYSDLKLYDFQTGAARSLTQNVRILSMDLSPGETQLAAIQTAVPTTQLVTISVENGMVDTLLNIPHHTFSQPRWSHNGEWIAFALQDSSGRQDIAQLHVDSGNWRYLYTPDIFHDTDPCWTPDDRYVLYASDKSGIFNIWAVEAATGKRWQITDVELGAFMPDVSPDSRELAFSTYTYTGFCAATMPLDSNRWLPEASMQPNAYPLAYPEKDTIYTNAQSPENPGFKTTSYKPWSQILRPQAWLPLPFEDEGGTTLGVAAVSQDVLHRHLWFGTFAVSTSGFRPAVDFSYTYRRWWPEFNIRGFYLPDEVSAGGQRGWWREQGFELTTALPLLLESNIYSTFVRPFFGVRLEDRKHSTGNIFPELERYRGFQFGVAISRVAWTRRDVVPHRALNIIAFADKSSSALGSEFDAHQFSGLADVFLPTLIRHHQLEFLGMYQNRRGNFDYDDFGALPIGYDDDLQPQQLRLKTAYHLPLAYLEWPFPFIAIYFDYLAVSLFFDWGTSWRDGFEPDQWTETDRYSIGLQPWFRTIILRNIPLNIAMAFYYHSRDRAWKVEPVIGLELDF